ncbi:hypothetical protein [Cerasicoccus fimbriatus]|uniref:hypothetical protein n=1 Tax=Cerasicoccus fimbriatus TaxID=3014554 RepID=UPI0022B5844B|nr:hypothetical protein [Cerasicoccus sp. TK19100]
MRVREFDFAQYHLFSAYMVASGDAGRYLWEATWRLVPLSGTAPFFWLVGLDFRLEGESEGCNGVNLDLFIGGFWPITTFTYG